MMARRVVAGRGGFSPKALFAAGEQGVWYDPSDFSTLFQDAAGTTPVTAVEQPVGLMLDKSKGLVLGPELVTNGDFSNGTTGWVQQGNSTRTVVDGVFRITTPTTNGDSGAKQLITGLTAGKTYRVSGQIRSVSAVATQSGSIRWANGNVTSGYSYLNGIGVSPNFINVSGYITPSGTNVSLFLINGGANLNSSTYEFDNISVRELPGNHAYQTTSDNRPVLSARVNQYLATETLATQNITTLAAQYRLSFEGMGTVTLSGTATGVYSAGLHLITCTAGTLTSTVSGSVTKADLRVANTGVNLPPYQRVNTATDYDTVGFPHYLRFDGSDDWLVTRTITPGIDKAQVFAGVRALTFGSYSAIFEFSSNWVNNAGSLALWGSVLSAGNNRLFESGSRGSVAATDAQNAFVSGTSSNVPITSVLAATHDIAGDLSTIRSNGVAKTNGTADKGTGNFLAYPLYIGSRGGTTLPFNGHLYSLIVRFGANLSAGQIASAENYINSKTLAF